MLKILDFGNGSELKKILIFWIIGIKIGWVFSYPYNQKIKKK
jgi:hypothetical protein